MSATPTLNMDLEPSSRWSTADTLGLPSATPDDATTSERLSQGLLRRQHH